MTNMYDHNVRKIAQIVGDEPNVSGEKKVLAGFILAEAIATAKENKTSLFSESRRNLLPLGLPENVVTSIETALKDLEATVRPAGRGPGW